MELSQGREGTKSYQRWLFPNQVQLTLWSYVELPPLPLTVAQNHERHFFNESRMWIMSSLEENAFHRKSLAAVEAGLERS